MPVPIKIIVSCIALIVAVTVFYIDWKVVEEGVNSATKWVALALGPLMVLAIWVFPEAKKREVDDIRKANAQKTQS